MQNFYILIQVVHVVLLKVALRSAFIFVRTFL